MTTEGPVKIPVPPHLLTLVGREGGFEGKHAVLTGEHPLSPDEEGIALLILASDPDAAIRSLARERVRQMDPERAATIVSHSRHPLVIRLFHLLRGTADAAPSLPSPASAGPETDDGSHDQQERYVSFDEEGEEFRTKFQLAQKLGVSEKIKYALTGDKEWRSILIRDSNKQVSGAVIKNPRITDAEVLAICKSAIQNDEVIREICHNREWVKNYQIRKALVENPRTPLANALRFLSTLGEKDLAALARSKNIPSVLSNQARRLLLQKKKE